MSTAGSNPRPTSKWAPAGIPRVALGAAYQGAPDFIVLEEEQREALFALAQAKRSRLDGPPGSGKTQLAAYLALASAMNGQRVLYLCPRKPLAAWLKWNIDCYGVCVRTINGHLTDVMAKSKGEVVERYSIDDADFFMAALRAVQPGSYDLVVVDEWQATTPDERSFVRAVAGGAKLVEVLDSSRALHPAPAPDTDSPLELKLLKRHRVAPCEPDLLEEAAASAAASAEGKGLVEGLAVSRVAAGEELGPVLQREVDGLLASGFAPNQVGIVSCLTRAESKVLGASRHKMKPRAALLGEVACNSGLLADSWAYWLGMERQAIVVVEAPRSLPSRTIRLRTAMSRACKSVRVVVRLEE